MADEKEMCASLFPRVERRKKMKCWMILSLMAVILYAPHKILSEEIFHSATYSPSDLMRSQVSGYDIIRLRGCEMTNAIGEPQVPLDLLQVAIPAGAVVEDVEIVHTESQILEGSYDLYPCQPPHILSQSDAEPIPLVQQNRETYGSDNDYPGTLVEFCLTGNMGDCAVAGFLVYPVHYVPSRKMIRLYTRIDFVIHYVPGEEPLPVATRRSGIARKVYSDLLSHSVVGYGVADGGFLRRSDLDADHFEYVIITSDAYRSTFQQLADWKTRKGVPAAVRTVSWIQSNFAGRDTGEQIRNYLKRAYADSGLVWVLLGGDTDVVPERIAYAMTSDAGSPGEDDLRADLYYSDLDGDWDANGNSEFGEVDDSVDLYPELFVGRAPVNTLSEALTFVEKIIEYEKTPPVDYQLNTLFFAEVLWSNPYTDGGVGKNHIESAFFPDHFNIMKLYESLGNENPSSVIAAINDGKHIMNHDGHGWYNYMGVGTGGLYPSDMDALSNGSRQSILYSIGCWVGAIHYNAISEHFINNPAGGGVAFIGNSSYGWGSPGNPGYGYSDRFDATFYEKLFEDDLHHIGVTLAADKIHYVPKSRQENVYRWHQYQLNLLGDPEMSIWTDTPRALEVAHLDTIVAGQAWLSVTVTDDSEPVQGALVCLFKQGDVYERGYTGSDGQMRSPVQCGPGEIQVTVTHHNFIPYEGAVQVKSTGAWVQYLSHAVVDTPSGNGDGAPNPGEIIDLPLTIQNSGDQSVSDLTAVLRTSNGLAEVMDSTAIYSSELLPGDTATQLFRVSISEYATNGTILHFILLLTDGDDEWQDGIGIVVAAPVLAYVDYAVDDTALGNGNGVPEPGEEFLLLVSIRNCGLGTAYSTEADLTTLDPYVVVSGSHAVCGDIPSDSIAYAYFTLEAESGCPNPHFADLELVCTAGTEISYDTVLCTIGMTGFVDDMEEGEGEWTHGGLGTFWLTTHRSHSDTLSWYCGREGTWVYSNFMEMWLLSPRFVLGPNSHLTFWQWCEFTNYGVDGLYVEFICAEGVDTLDFIGSGGALDSLLYIGNDWLRERYDLSSYPAGDTCQIGFRFKSDGSDVAEGIYIDDIRVGPRLSPEIYVNSSTIEICAEAGGHASDTFGVHNFGEGYLDFYVQVGEAVWLSTAPTHGLVAPGDSVSVAVSVDASELAESTYSAVITIINDDLTRPVFTIPVHLEVIFPFFCGDCNDDGVVTVADAIYIVTHVYRGGPLPIGEGDVNLDGRITIADAIYLVSYIYRGGSPPCEPSLPKARTGHEIPGVQ